MKALNRFIVFTKRILTHKLYIVMLFSIILLTVIYACLPASERSADIKVSIYSEEAAANTAAIMDKISSDNSLYTFYLTSDMEKMISDVKSGYAECGYYIPENFFEDYIDGLSGDNQIIQYTTPSTTLGATINETLFATIFTLCSDRLLTLSVDIPEYDSELTGRLDYYVKSDNIFRIKNSVTGEFSYKDYIYQIKLPVYEICLVFMLFSSLLGLLLFQQDKEKNMYVALGKHEQSSIELTAIISAIIPVMLTSLISAIITGLTATRFIHLILWAVLFSVFTFILGLIIKKSTILTKVLPLIILISIIVVFLSTLL